MINEAKTTAKEEAEKIAAAQEACQEKNAAINELKNKWQAYPSKSLKK